MTRDGAMLLMLGLGCEEDIEQSEEGKAKESGFRRRFVAAVEGLSR